MATSKSMKSGSVEGILHASLHYRPKSGEQSDFVRADLVFTGVDHSDLSYEVRVFLNNPEAGEKTPCEQARGYAGCFTIFGHGGCFGDLGHCDIRSLPKGSHDLRPAHPLVPQTKVVEITAALNKILQESEQGLTSVTLVPIAKTPRRADYAITAELFKFEDMKLRTYR